jgi:hypothetical protein
MDSKASVAAADQLMPSIATRKDVISLANFSFRRPEYVILDESYASCLPAMVEDALGTRGLAAYRSCYTSENWQQQFAQSGAEQSWLSLGYRLLSVHGSILILQEQAVNDSH